MPGKKQAMAANRKLAAALSLVREHGYGNNSLDLDDAIRQLLQAAIMDRDNAQTLTSKLAANSALLELVLSRLEEAGGTNDGLLRRQIIDLQQDIRQGADNALAYWRDEVERKEEEAKRIDKDSQHLRSVVADYHRQLAVALDALNKIANAGWSPGQEGDSYECLIAEKALAALSGGELSRQEREAESKRQFRELAREASRLPAPDFASLPTTKEYLDAIRGKSPIAAGAEVVTDGEAG